MTYAKRKPTAEVAANKNKNKNQNFVVHMHMQAVRTFEIPF